MVQKNFVVSASTDIKAFRNTDERAVALICDKVQGDSGSGPTQLRMGSGGPSRDPALVSIFFAALTIRFIAVHRLVKSECQPVPFFCSSVLHFAT